MAEQEFAEIVEVVYAKPATQVLVELPWSPGLTARDAVDRSGLLLRFAEIDSATLVLGVFGKRVAQTYLLRAGDRVEICRPLGQNPREMRRAALSSGSVMGRVKG